jgi:hypothetical protein
MESMDTLCERCIVLEQPMNILETHPHPGERRGRWRHRPWSVVAVAAIGLALALPLSVQAKTFSCSAGDSPCLIAAITAANTNGQETNRILLAAGTYPLTAVDNTTDGPNGLPSIISHLTIAGAGAETTSIERPANAPAFRLLHVAATGSLTLKLLTLRGGQTGFSGSFLGGGGVANRGALTLTTSIIIGNRARDGGGIDNVGGTVTLTNCTIADNAAGIEGGGIETGDGTVILTNCTIAGNGATGAGGIGNRGTMTVTNCTIAGNSTLEGSAIINSASGTLALLNTIFAQNRTFFGVHDCGQVTSLGNNLIGDPTACTITLQPTDLTGDPGLGAFTDTGSPGHGHFPLLPTSQAIDAGNDAGCPQRDQRGERRVNILGVGTSRCDIGAIEFQKQKAPRPGEDIAQATP